MIKTMVIVALMGLVGCSGYLDTKRAVAQKANELLSYYCAKPAFQRETFRESMKLPAGYVEVHCASDEGIPPAPLPDKES